MTTSTAYHRIGKAPTSPLRLGVIVGCVAVVAVVAGLLVLLVLDTGPAERPAQPTANQQSAANQQAAADLAAIAEMARTQGLTGLSPASLTPIEGNVGIEAHASAAVAEHGSVSAIEQRQRLAARRADAGRTVAEHGSVSAIEHREEVATAP